MTRDLFRSTIVMLGWTKLNQSCYQKTVNNEKVLVLCYESGVLVIRGINVKSEQDLNNFITYEAAFTLINKDFKE